MGIDALGIGAISNFLSNVIDKIFPDKTKAMEAKAELAKLQITDEFAQASDQLKINLAEAASTNWFVAGWRPFVGWICGAAFGWSYVIGPMFYWISSLVGKPTPIPTLDLASMMPVLLGMLGLGGLRTYEKKTETEGNR